MLCSEVSRAFTASKKNALVVRNMKQEARERTSSQLMSSLAGAFNASSTLFTLDFYRKLHPEASQAQLVWIGRAATTVMVLIALAWIPVPLFLLGMLIGPRPFNHPAMAWFPVLSGWREGPECLPGPFAAISPGVQALVTVLGWAVMVWALRRAAHADKPG